LNPPGIPAGNVKHHTHNQEIAMKVKSNVKAGGSGTKTS
jgi:hypothetical protein